MHEIVMSCNLGSLIIHTLAILSLPLFFLRRTRNGLRVLRDKTDAYGEYTFPRDHHTGLMGKIS